MPRGFFVSKDHSVKMRWCWWLVLNQTDTMPTVTGRTLGMSQHKYRTEICQVLGQKAASKGSFIRNAGLGPHLFCCCCFSFFKANINKNKQGCGDVCQEAVQEVASISYSLPEKKKGFSYSVLEENHISKSFRLSYPVQVTCLLDDYA